MREDVSIIVMSCDAYSDLWHDFFVLKDLYWNKCEYPTYLVTNSKDCTENNVKTILCGDVLNWTGRLLYSLEQIHSKYVILMLEDYYISDYVDSKISEAITFIESNNVVYYKLEERTPLFTEYYGDSKFLKKIDANVEYGISLLTSIWSVDFLKKVINNEDYTAWEFEIKRNLKNDITHSLDGLCLCDTRNILHIEHMVQRGKYLREGLRRFKKKGYIIDYRQRGKLDIITSLYLDLHLYIRQNKQIFSLVRSLFSLFGIKSISEKYAEEIKKDENKYK